MGDYTLLKFSANLRSDLPWHIFEVLSKAANSRMTYAGTADKIAHPFFRTSRWSMLFLGGSASHETSVNSRMIKNEDDSYRLTFESSFKNHDKEIELFLDWITPYIQQPDNSELGFFEEPFKNYPTELFFVNGGILEQDTTPVNEEEFNRGFY